MTDHRGNVVLLCDLLQDLIEVGYCEADGFRSDEITH